MLRPGRGGLAGGARSHGRHLRRPAALTAVGTRAPARPDHRRILVILAAGGLAYALLQTMVAPVLPVIQRQYDASPAAVTWVLTGYQLAAAIATPVLGRFGDMFGKVRILVGVLTLFAGGTLMCALVDTLPLLIGGRVVQGAGGAIFPLAFGIVRDEFPADRVAAGIGLISSTFGVGGVAGLVLAGVIVDHLDYRWIFWLALVVIVAATLATWRCIPESPIRDPAPVDWVGAGLFAAGAGGVLILISEGGRWGWTSASVLGLGALSAGLLVGCGVYEARARFPLIDVRMLRQRAVWTADVTALLAGFGMFAQLLVVPQLVQAPLGRGAGFGASVTQAGLFLIPSSLGMLIGGPAAGWLGTRVGSRTPLLAGIACAAAGFFQLALVHDAAWHVYLNSLAIGLGLGLSFAAMAAVIVAAVPPEKTAAATGMNAIMRALGGALNAQVTAGILGAHTGADGWPTATGFVTAMLTAAGALVLALVVGLMIPGSRPDGGTGGRMRQLHAGGSPEPVVSEARGTRQRESS